MSVVKHDQKLLKTFDREYVGMQRDAKIFLPANTDRQQYPRADFDNLLMGSPDFRSDLVNWSAISDAVDTRNLSPRDQALLWDLVLFGDGGAFVDRIVTPVFRHALSTVDLSIWTIQARCTQCCVILFSRDGHTLLSCSFEFFRV